MKENEYLNDKKNGVKVKQRLLYYSDGLRSYSVASFRSIQYDTIRYNEIHVHDYLLTSNDDERWWVLITSLNCTHTHTHTHTHKEYKWVLIIKIKKNT